MLNRLFKDVASHLTWPFIVLVAVGLVLMHSAIMLISNRADQLSEARETRLVTNAVEVKLNGIAMRARESMARSEPDILQPVDPHERMLLLDAGGNILWSRRAAQAARWSPEGLDEAVGPALRMLADPVRQQGEARPAGLNFLWIGGEPMLIVAVHALDHPDQTLVDIADLNDQIPQLLRFNLPGLAFTPASKPEAAPLRLLDQSGGLWLDRINLGVEWKKLAVGHTIVSRALPLIWGVTLAFLACGGLLIDRTRRLAKSLVASETHAKHLALHDPMTGLANRALFADRLDHAIELRRRSGGQIAVAVIDLDHFKRVNDTLGHQAGDALIREASRRIAAICRSSDTVARLGGDEFAVVLSPIEGRAGLESLCGRLNRALTSVLDLTEGQAILSASIGAAVIDDDRTEAVDAIRRADLALYRTKAEGRGGYRLFEPEMDENQRLRRLVEIELRKALKAGALDVAYQPQFTARGRIEGVEALVRWTHPQRGAIAPAQFIPIAEEAGLIDELGEFVFKRALADAAHWPGLKIAINVSPIQLRSADFVGRCQAMAEAAGIEPGRIELEITEGVLLDGAGQTQPTLMRLREAGFRLALDDFGTGYSSLSYLSAYPVDRIKIDRSFVSNLSLDGEADKVVRAIIHLGRSLGLSVTAEGVETEAQRMKLIAAGCNSLQGFLHGPPMPAADIDARLAAGARRRGKGVAA